MTTLHWPTAAALASKDPAVLPDALRLAALTAIMNAGSGHIGASFSSAEIWAWLAIDHPDDIWVSSRGHDAPAYYAALVAAGKLDATSLRTLRLPGGLPGHPEARTPGVAASTGSLGAGLSKAVGIAAADLRRKVYVVCGDGETQEGQFWEAIEAASDLLNIMVIVDRNGYQSDRRLSLKSFPVDTRRAFGHKITHLRQIERTRPTLMVAETVKGRGVSFMEPSGDVYRYHSGAPTWDEYLRAVVELRTRTPIECDTTEMPERPPKATHPVIAAYSHALVVAGMKDERIVVLDADLSVDSGLEPFRYTFPDRFYECGIAEQHMASMAGGLALAGRLPICHTFASFWRRAVDQVWMNHIDRTHIVYVGSLTRPHAAGPSHDAAFDREMFGHLGCEVVECYAENEMTGALTRALRSSGGVYLRLP